MQSRLEEYAKSVQGVEKNLALVAARWISADPTSVHDPLLSELWKRVEYREECWSEPDLRTATDNTVGNTKKSILSYFHTPTNSVVTRSDSTSRLQIYCDGACRANGRKGAKAGYGVSVQREGKELQAISKALDPSEPQTNQRAELRGLQKALEFGKAEGADIYTDSEYGRKCLESWAATWAAKGWRKADGSAVLHQDILRPMWDMWKARGSTRLFHVSAHTGHGDAHSKGNERADALATQSIRAYSAD
jgi:ribonuclease HI